MNRPSSASSGLWPTRPPSVVHGSEVVYDIHVQYRVEKSACGVVSQNTSCKYYFKRVSGLLLIERLPVVSSCQSVSFD